MYRFVIVATGVFGLLMGCSTAPQSASATADIRKALDQSGLKDVSVAQDRDKGVVTLTGHVAHDVDKARAGEIATTYASSQVVANEVAVLPAGDTGDAKAVNADLDKGVDNNLDAALISGGYRTGIHHSVKNGVVTLTGTVDKESQRAQIEALAKGVPNVLQVVNEVQTRHQKATSSTK